MDEQLTRMMQFIQSMQSDNGENKMGRESYGYPDMLTAMRPMLPYKKQRMIDLLIKAFEMQEIWDEMRSSYGN